MVMMQGILWKWTNYLSGWQPRWFILDYGVLAYYRSQDEVHLGSRGSVKLSCCEIYVHPTDPVRLDLKIPPENHIYLRASTPLERQQWLVALGTAKACRTDTSYEQQQQQINSMSYLKEKMSELNICRNIIVQQAHQLKSLTSKQDNTNKDISEAATLLSASCDSFLSNLNDMMEVVEDALSTTSSSPVSTPIRVKSTPTFKKHSSHSEVGTPPLSSPSSFFTDSFSESERGNLKIPPPNSLTIKTTHDTKSTKTPDPPVTTPSGIPVAVSPSTITTSTTTTTSDSLSALSRQSVESQSPEEAPKISPKSFFSNAPARFDDIQISVDGCIPTKSFLDACSSIIPVFDMLGSTTFAPVKMDIHGNITKIQTKYSTDEKAFVFLQNIIFQELKSNTCTAKNSTTDALLWLKRALEFIHIFLAEICRGEQDLAVAATNAYGRSLRKYHGWVVRGVFSLAVKAVPYRKDFIKCLSIKNSDIIATEAEIVEEMKNCIGALGRILNIICQFYKRHKLDSDNIV
eukprot:gene17395-19137_t